MRWKEETVVGVGRESIHVKEHYTLNCVNIG